MKAVEAENGIEGQEAQDIEQVCAAPGYRLNAFGGLSRTLLHSEVRHDEMVNIEDPLFKEVRLSGGIEIQTNRTASGTLLPRRCSTEHARPDPPPRSMGGKSRRLLETRS